MPAKSRHPQTKGMSASVTRSSKDRVGWRAKLLAAKQRPESFLLLAWMFRECLVSLMADTLLEKNTHLTTPIDWEALYTQIPHTMSELNHGFSPRLSFPPMLEDEHVGRFALEVAEGLGQALNEFLPLANPKTGVLEESVALKTPQLRQVYDLAKRKADILRLEIRASADNLKACLLYHQLMGHLLEAGKQGDDKSLLRAIGINPHLVRVGWIADRLSRAVQTRDRTFLRRLELALRENSRFQKLGVIGLVLQIGWDAGLKKLSFTQLQEFLREAGFQSVPDAKPLEKYAQRLGLKKYYVEGKRPALAAR